MKIRKKLLEGTWIDWEDGVKLLIRPMPMSKQMINLNGDTFVGNYGWSVFENSVLDWSGFVDDNDKEMPCNPANKKIVFDLLPDISTFVVNEQAKLASKEDKEVKNSETSPVG